MRDACYNCLRQSSNEQVRHYAKPQNRRYGNPKDDTARYFRQRAEPAPLLRIVPDRHCLPVRRTVPECVVPGAGKNRPYAAHCRRNDAAAKPPTWFCPTRRPVDRHKHMLAFRKHTFDAFDHGPRVLNRLRLLHVFHGFLRFLGFHHRRLRAHYSSTVKRYAREPSPSPSAYSSVCSPCLVAIRSVTDAPSGAT